MSCGSRGARVNEDYDLSGSCCEVWQRINKASDSVTKSAGFCFESTALEYALQREGSAPSEGMGFVVGYISNE
jgi:hypothetical protein